METEAPLSWPLLANAGATVPAPPSYRPDHHAGSLTALESLCVPGLNLSHPSISSI